MTMTTPPMTKDQFEAALAAANIPSWREPRVERDGECAYDCFDNDDGDEIGFVSYRGGEVIGYTIHDR